MSVDRALLFRLATSTRLERAARATPPGAALARRAASRYVAGTTLADATRLARRLHERGMASSLDQFGERVDDPEAAEHVSDDYRRLAGETSRLPQDAWLSIDLSHLGLDLDPQTCAHRLIAIAEALPIGRRIQVGAEDHA